MQQALNIMFFNAVEHGAKVPLGLFAAQYRDFSCLWMSLSSFSEAFIIHQDTVFDLVRKLYVYTI